MCKKGIFQPDKINFKPEPVPADLPGVQPAMYKWVYFLEIIINIYQWEILMLVTDACKQPLLGNFSR